MKSTRAVLLSLLSLSIYATSLELQHTLQGTNTSPSSFLNLTCLPPQRPDDEQLCLFTAPSFWSGRGLSFFSNDVTHSIIHTLGAIQDPGSHLLPPLPKQNERVYDVVALPGKGMSGIASKVINPGEIVLAEHPVLLLQSPDDGRDYDTHRLPFYTIMVETLQPKAKEAFLGLSSSVWSETEVGGIIATNSFAVYIGDEAHKAVFPETSRFNHECRPNTEYSWSQETLSMTLRALRRIEPGEEITISYINPILPTQQRKEELWSYWGFECTCSFCSLPPSSIVLSDNRTSALNDILWKLENPLYLPVTTTLHDIEHMVDQGLSLAREERLMTKIPDVYVAAAKIASEMEWKEDKRIVEKGIEWVDEALMSGRRIYGDVWVHEEQMGGLLKVLIGRR